MKVLWLLLLPSLAAAGSSVAKDEHSFMDSCSEIELDPTRGLLDTFCSSPGSTTADHVSQVDLNGCLGWGPSSDSASSIKNVENVLFPAEGGNFSQFCNSCHIIRDNESKTQVGHILCSCAPTDSDVALEYMYDLKEIVHVNASGCLTCGKAPSMCTQIKNFKSALLKGEPGSPAAVPRLNGGLPPSLGRHENESISDCDKSIGKAHKRWPQAIPETFQDRPIRPCEEHEGPGLCCFFAVEDEGFRQQAFQIIENSNYIYRVQYSQGRDEGKKYTELTLIRGFCKNPDMCPGGESDDHESHTTSIPKPTSTLVSNTSSTSTPHVSIHRTLAATLEKRAIRSSTTLRQVTGVPDSHILTSTLTSATPSSRGLTSVSSKPPSPELKIDLSKLDASGLVDIMLEATNMDEVRHAQLNLLVSTNCFTYKDGQVNCKKVIVELTGHKIGGDAHQHAVPDLETQPVIIPTETSVARQTSTPLAAVSTHTSSTGTPLHQVSVPQSYLADSAQAVLGPRAATPAGDYEGPAFTTVGGSTPEPSDLVL